MLQDLKILNGELSLKFDPYQTKYSVNVANDVSSLLFDYVVIDDAKVDILNNDLTRSDEVRLKVTKDEKTTFYTFNVLKEEEVSTSDMIAKELEVIAPKEISPYAVPSIASISFLLILFLFVLLFSKKKSK